jgi:MoxR-like ATPase
VEMGEGVSQQRAVLVRGEVGVGKTSLVVELAARTGRGRSDLLTLQISDSTDSRLLVGLYR